MVRRRRKRRKRFPCGHSGFGRWCHRCQPLRRPSAPLRLPKPSPRSQETALQRSRRLARRQAARCRWQARFAHDPIPLDHLPKPIVMRARRILAALEAGIPPGELRGRRFSFDRTLLRIPVTYRYRLLCRWNENGITPLMVLSHEDYNAVARNKRTMGAG